MSSKRKCYTNFIYDKTDFFRVENWYTLLKDYTFPTKYFSLTREQGRALCRYKELLNHFFQQRMLENTMEEKMKEHNNHNMDSPENVETAMKMSYTPKIFEELQEETRKLLSPEEWQPLQTLTQQINDVIKEFKQERLKYHSENYDQNRNNNNECLSEGDDEFGVFVRLSSRSPKDSVLLLSSTFRYIEEMIQNSKYSNIPGINNNNNNNNNNIGEENGDMKGEKEKKRLREEFDIYLRGGKSEFNLTEKEENAIIYNRAIWFALRSQTGEDAINLLLKSARSLDDLTFAELQQQDEEFSMQLIVREWKNIIPEFEFRIFIVGGKLAACTQYYPSIFHPMLSENRENIKTKIEEFWSDLCSKVQIPVADLTLDIYFDVDLSSIHIVEINPPAPTAGGSLFDWDHDADLLSVMSNEQHFELRVNDSFPLKHFLKLHPPLLQFIDQCRLKYSSNICNHNPTSSSSYIVNSCTLL